MSTATIDDSMDDDVFEALEDHPRLKVRPDKDRQANTPSPTGYRDYKPPAEVLRLCENDVIESSEQKIHKVPR